MGGITWWWLQISIEEELQAVRKEWEGVLGLESRFYRKRAIGQQERATEAERHRKQQQGGAAGDGAASALVQGHNQKATGPRRFVQSTGTCGDVVDTRAL